MPTKNGRGLDEQGCFTPSRRDSRGKNNHEALPARPPDAPGNLPLGGDELLSKEARSPQPALRGGEPDPPPARKRTEEGRSRVESYIVHARMEFVARTTRCPSHDPQKPASVSPARSETTASGVAFSSSISGVSSNSCDFLVDPLKS